jgi:hypothetical protein
MKYTSRYPGVKPFETDEQNIFFGRSNDINTLYDLVGLEKTVLLYSKSGLGKSSLINAGLIPKLNEDKNINYKHFIIRLGVYKKDNSQSPKVKTIELIKSDLIENSLINFTELYENSLSFWLKMLQLNTQEQTTVLIFDQFEELFTYPDYQIEEFNRELHELLYLKTSAHFRKKMPLMLEQNKDAFTDEQLNILSSAVNVRLLFAIRSDYLSMLNKLTDYLPNLQHTFYELKPLDNKEARNAIIKPAEIDGDFPCLKFEFTNDAIDKIINALSDNGKQSIETFQLQIVCQFSEGLILNNILKRSITPDDLGDIKEIHQSFYKKLMEELSVESEEEKMKLHVLLEEQFIYEPEQRRLQVLKGIILKSITENTLSALEKTHLIRSEPYQDSFTYELSHDTLVEPILKSYRERKESEEQKESLKRREEELQTIRIKALRQRNLIIFFSTAFLLSASFAIFGFIMWQKAEAEKEKALRISQSLKMEQQSSRKLKYEKYIIDGNYAQENANYDEAIQNYKIACEFSNDTIKLQKLIKYCKDKSELKKDFDILIQTGIGFQNEENKYAEALLKFNAALKLDFDNKSVLLRINELNSKIEVAVREMKQKAKIFIDAGGIQDALEILISAKKMKPNDYEIKQLLDKYQE